MPRIIHVSPEQWSSLKPLLLSLLKEEPSFKFLPESAFDYVVIMSHNLDQWGEDELEMVYICNNPIRQGYYKA